MATGKIKTWHENKGFGFIKQDSGENDVFLHITKVKENERDLLVKGTIVNFETEKTDKGLAAINVTLERGSPSEDKVAESKSSSKVTESKSSPNVTHFHNPYTFVPTPPRPSDGFAGDFNPLCKQLDHASLNQDLWTGHIPIKITTVTPLVLLKDDGRERDTTEHQTYDVHDRIPESSLRGMLRSAYETVTNSRYSCFGKNNDAEVFYRIGKKKHKHPKSPSELLDDSLKPAKNMNQLSPADRLFGWTPQGQVQDEGYKSRIRVVCEEVVLEDNEDAENDKKQEILQRFEGGALPLTILSEPKSSYVYFYVAKNKQGEPQDSGLTKKKAGYDGNKGLRGRKQYWHHRGLESDDQELDYWKTSVEDRTQIKCNERYQEYRRPDKYPENSQTGWQQKDDQNRSITGWIRPGVEFKASLYVQNLENKEVGALLWLLSLPANHYFRLGYGKPLGFGSIKMKIDDRCPSGCLPLSIGEDWKSYYEVFDADVDVLAKLDENQRNCYIQEFKTSMENAYPNHQCFDDLPFINGFLQVLHGSKTDLPIHYPRLEEKPNPEGKSLEWFKANDTGLKLVLPAVTTEEGLPYNPKV